MWDDAVRGHLRLRTWHRVAHGIYRREGVPDLYAWQLVLPPSGRFTHLTAAAAYGWWLPPLPAAGLPVWAAMCRDEPRPQRRGMIALRRKAPDAATLVNGLKLDPPAEVLLSAARDLGTLDLVVLADAALASGHCSMSDLQAAASGRRWGAPALRKASALADPRSESPYETLLRVLHVVCDVDVVPQRELRDGEGQFVARGDLWLRGTTTIHEYDGGDHLTVQQQRKDLARERRIGNETWLRRGYTQRDLLTQGVGILRDADLSLGRPHDPRRIRAWHRLLSDSLFTPSGQERLRQRLRAGAQLSGEKLQ